MVAIKLNLFLFINVLYVTNCERRITNGTDVTTDKSYVVFSQLGSVQSTLPLSKLAICTTQLESSLLSKKPKTPWDDLHLRVYLVKAPNSGRIYDEWLCGGALVSTLFIVTSAACVADVEFMYAIAGYKKYVTDAEVEADPCTKEKKKKVIYTCVPMKYQLDYNQVEVWSFIDIALVKVESPYDLNDESYLKLCSYKPNVIPINYEARFQKPGTDTLTYGWGHASIWRKEEDKNNYNKQFMQFASSKIIEKTECKQQYEAYTKMTEVIDQYMICTSGKGDFSDKGELEIEPKPLMEGCLKKTELKLFVDEKDGAVVPSNTSVFEVCEDDTTFEDMLKDETRRRDENINLTSSNSSQNKNRTVFNKRAGISRKHGICQNDHGGPLVTWIGGNEVLIGVASVFRVSNDLKCVGPYLYTSTQCNGAFLDCILSNSDLPDVTNRRAICESPPIQRGYDTVERYISWTHHPAGPADNEKNDDKVARELKRYDIWSTKVNQNLLRFSMLSKMAKDQSDTILRQRRPNPSPV